MTWLYHIIMGYIGQIWVISYKNCKTVWMAQIKTKKSSDMSPKSLDSKNFMSQTNTNKSRTFQSLNTTYRRVVFNIWVYIGLRIYWKKSVKCSSKLLNYRHSTDCEPVSKQWHNPYSVKTLTLAPSIL